MAKEEKPITVAFCFSARDCDVRTINAIGWFFSASLCTSQPVTTFFIGLSLLSVLGFLFSLQKALDVLSHMNSWKIKFDATTYAQLIEVYNLRGDYDSSLRHLTRAQKRNLEMNTALYAEAIRTYCVLGRFTDAREVFQKMVADGLLPDEAVQTSMVLLNASCGDHNGEFLRDSLSTIFLGSEVRSRCKSSFHLLCLPLCRTL